MTAEADRLTVYYDGACPLCRAEIDHYAKQDGAAAIRFADVSGADASPGEGLTREQALTRFHVRRGDGALISGAAAFVAIWQRLPRWRGAARLAALPGVVPILEVGYRLFLPVRPLVSRWFGRWQARRRGAGPRQTGSALRPPSPD